MFGTTPSNYYNWGYNQLDISRVVLRSILNDLPEGSQYPALLSQWNYIKQTMGTAYWIVEVGGFFSGLDMLILNLLWTMPWQANKIKSWGNRRRGSTANQHFHYWKKEITLASHVSWSSLQVIGCNQHIEGCWGWDFFIISFLCSPHLRI